MKNIEFSNIVFTKDTVIFPNSTGYVTLRNSKNKKKPLINEEIIIFPIKSIFDFLFYKKKFATISKIISVDKDNSKSIITVKGIQRVRLNKIKKFQIASYSRYNENIDIDFNRELTDSLRKKAQELIFLINAKESDKLIELLTFIFNLSQMTDYVANYFILKYKQRYKIYNNSNIENRANLLLSTISKIIKHMKKM